MNDRNNRQSGVSRESRPAARKPEPRPRILLAAILSAASGALQAHPGVAEHAHPHLVPEHLLLVAVGVAVLWLVRAARPGD